MQQNISMHVGMPHKFKASGHREGKILHSIRSKVPQDARFVDKNLQGDVAFRSKKIDSLRAMKPDIPQRIISGAVVDKYIATDPAPSIRQQMLNTFSDGLRKGMVQTQGDQSGQRERPNLDEAHALRLDVAEIRNNLERILPSQRDELEGLARAMEEKADAIEQAVDPMYQVNRTMQQFMKIVMKQEARVEEEQKMSDEDRRAADIAFLEQKAAERAKMEQKSLAEASRIEGKTKKNIEMEQKQKKGMVDSILLAKKKQKGIALVQGPENPIDFIDAIQRVYYGDLIGDQPGLFKNAQEFMQWLDDNIKQEDWNFDKIADVIGKRLHVSPKTIKSKAFKYFNEEIKEPAPPEISPSGASTPTPTPTSVDDQEEKVSPNEETVMDFFEKNIDTLQYVNYNGRNDMLGKFRERFKHEFGDDIATADPKLVQKHLEDELVVGEKNRRDAELILKNKKYSEEDKQIIEKAILPDMIEARSIDAFKIPELLTAYKARLKKDDDDDDDDDDGKVSWTKEGFVKNFPTADRDDLSNFAVKLYGGGNIQDEEMLNAYEKIERTAEPGPPKIFKWVTFGIIYAKLGGHRITPLFSKKIYDAIIKAEDDGKQLKKNSVEVIVRNILKVDAQWIKGKDTSFMIGKLKSKVQEKKRANA